MVGLYLEQVDYNVKTARGLHVKTTTRKHLRRSFHHYAIYLAKHFTAGLQLVFYLCLFLKHINSVSYQMLSSLQASLCLRSHQWLYQTAHRQCKPWRRAKNGIYQRNTPSNWVPTFCCAAARTCRLWWRRCTKTQRHPLLIQPRAGTHMKDEFCAPKSS